ncbi:hypothetical protein TNCV_3843921 [Trichonephila clavipes]|nr:hypothetical protein TNCV_3843921 [Trichonephila clavipes]
MSSVASSTIHYDMVRFHPNIEEEHPGVSTSFRKGTIHLQISIPSPGFKPRPNGTAVSITSPYTEWGVLKLHPTTNIEIPVKAAKWS